MKKSIYLFLLLSVIIFSPLKTIAVEDGAPDPCTTFPPIGTDAPCYIFDNNGNRIDFETAADVADFNDQLFGLGGGGSCVSETGLANAFCVIEKEILPLTAGIVVSLAFIYFLWGIMQYLLGDEKVKAAARSKILTSILIMFVMFSVWGIIALIDVTFSITNNPPSLGLTRVVQNNQSNNNQVDPPTADEPEPGSGGGAPAACSGQDFRYLLCLATNRVVNPLVAVLFLVAFVFFMLGLGKYLLGPGDDKSTQAAKDTMIWSVIGMFVLFSVWGLVRLITNTFNLNNQSLPVPSFSLAKDHRLW